PLAQSSVRLDDVVREVLIDFAEFAHQRTVDLGFAGESEAPVVRGVPLLMRELVANLVDNAIRYTPAGGTVTAAVRCSGDTVHLEVEDSGPGIPAHERERVFERFYRVDSSAPQEGSGLGLAIVREIAIVCGAQVQLCERPDGTQGLVARVTFPR